MSSNTRHCIEISEDILKGIHPNTTEAVDKKNVNKSQNNYLGIPEDILDGIHPRVQAQNQSNAVSNKPRKEFV